MNTYQVIGLEDGLDLNGNLIQADFYSVLNTDGKRGKGSTYISFYKEGVVILTLFSFPNAIRLLASSD